MTALYFTVDVDCYDEVIIADISTDFDKLRRKYPSKTIYISTEDVFTSTGKEVDNLQVFDGTKYVCEDLLDIWDEYDQYKDLINYETLGELDIPIDIEYDETYVKGSLISTTKPDLEHYYNLIKESCKKQALTFSSIVKDYVAKEITEAEAIKLINDLSSK